MCHKTTPWTRSVSEASREITYGSMSTIEREGFHTGQDSDVRKQLLSDLYICHSGC